MTSVTAATAVSPQDKNRDLYLCPVGQGAVGKEVSTRARARTLCRSFRGGVRERAAKSGGAGTRCSEFWLLLLLLLLPPPPPLPP